MLITLTKDTDEISLVKLTPYSMYMQIYLQLKAVFWFVGNLNICQILDAFL